MPYKRTGAHKISDHHVRSPVLNLNRACQTCHHWPEDELRSRVYTIQSRTYELRSMAMDALMDLIRDITAVGKPTTNSAPSPSIVAAQDFQRKAQFFLDFIEAENSMGFHASQESARILAHSVNFSRQGQATLRNQQTNNATASAR